jgi:hypothetical protein
MPPAAMIPKSIFEAALKQPALSESFARYK